MLRSFCSSAAKSSNAQLRLHEETSASQKFQAAEVILFGVQSAKGQDARTQRCGYAVRW